MKKIMKKIFGYLPHITLVLSLMMLTLYITDRQNRAMGFINNDITKALLAVMSVLVIVESVYLIVHLRRRQYEEYKKHRNRDE